MKFVRKIVDSNYLRREELEEYLSSSPRNIAVLTEFVMLEAQKKDPILTLAGSTEILSRYSRQVVVIRPSTKLLGFHGQSAGLQKRLIDSRQSAEFGRFCNDVRTAAAGDAQVSEIILRRAQSAKNHIDGLTDAAPTIIQLFQANSARFSEEEIRILRSRKPRPEVLQAKLLDLVFESASDVVAGAGIRPRRMPTTDAVNLPVVRYCLCMALLFIRWVEKGRQPGPNLKNEKIANDVIDANIAAFSTYFDGVLTGDLQLRSLAEEARYIFREVGGYVPGDLLR